MAVALIAVQLALDAGAVAGPAALEAVIARAVEDAVAQAGPAEHRLIVLPEAIGLAALVALAPERARAAPTLGALLARAALRRPLAMLRGALDARTLEPRHAALAALAPDVDRWTRETFARLARRTGAVLVGGSHLRLEVDPWARGRSDVVAAARAFDPDGRVLATTDKVNLLAGLEDRSPGGLGLARGDAERLPRITTAFGAIAVLVGYDAFVRADTPHERFVPLGPRLEARGGVAVATNPAASPWPWEEPLPPTVDPDGATARERWQTRGLAATMAQGPVARWGITAHLVGSILDVTFAGASEILRDGDGGVEVVARAGRADTGGAVTWVARDLG
jgi:predicted amidohydrolase